MDEMGVVLAGIRQYCNKMQEINTDAKRSGQHCDSSLVSYPSFTLFVLYARSYPTDRESSDGSVAGARGNRLPSNSKPLTSLILSLSFEKLTVGLTDSKSRFKVAVAIQVRTMGIILNPNGNDPLLERELSPIFHERFATDVLENLDSIRIATDNNGIGLARPVEHKEDTPEKRILFSFRTREFNVRPLIIRANCEFILTESTNRRETYHDLIGCSAVLAVVAQSQTTSKGFQPILPPLHAIIFSVHLRHLANFESPIADNTLTAGNSSVRERESRLTLQDALVQQDLSSNLEA
ncbi:hypothetical protein WN51_00894 [Melipona quadrifasciata]|uniref:Uncharacterized protein n=1 Tax=Melipona quadrifasciata TaxID=166423 RepID=A0A0M9ACE0_9HYME|nr:hypothetical protein WN51_00894 [Melipona quadrifasciata]